MLQVLHAHAQQATQTIAVSPSWQQLFSRGAGLQQGLHADVGEPRK